MTATAADPDDGASANPEYIGLATRTVAFAADAAIINLVALLVELGAALILSLFHLPTDAKKVIAVIGGAVWVLWSIAYFVGFWSATGQTIGNRAMRIRVVATDGQRLNHRRALLRCIGLVLSAIPLFAGYVLILFDGRRRAFHDRLARTVVVEAPAMSLAEVSRTRRAAARGAPSAPGPLTPFG